MSNDFKKDVYELFITGEFSKAELGREFGVSPRTIGRWIDEKAEQTKREAQDQVEDDRRITSLDQLESGDIIEFYDVRNNLPFAGLADEDFFEGVTAEVVEVNERYMDLSFQSCYGPQLQMTTLEAFDNGWKVRKVEEEEGEGASFNDMPVPFLSVIMTSDFLSIGANGEADTVTSDHPMFQDFYQQIRDSGMAQSVLHSVRQRMSVKNMIEGYEWNDIVVDAETEKVLYKGEEVRGVVVERIVSSMHRGDGTIEHLVKFLDKLMENPSFRAVNELYSFLEATDITIDENGYVLCFKKVSSDYKDLFSGTFDNSVGSTPSIDRNKVDEDMNRTCSYGLHVCSRSYLPHFGSRHGNRVMLVRVHPADFVAIPVDYNYAKARVCKYEVLDDVTDMYFD